MFKCSYVEEIAKAVALVTMISHLILPDLVHTFINDSVPDFLHKTVKPTFLAEPRSQSACQLIIWAVAALYQQGKGFLALALLRCYVDGLASVVVLPYPESCCLQLVDFTNKKVALNIELLLWC